MELARTVRYSMGNDAPLADQLARAATAHVGDAALVWIKPAEGGEPICLAAVDRDGDIAVTGAGIGGHDTLICAVLESGLPAVLDHADFAAHAAAIHPGLSQLVERRGSAAAILPLLTGAGMVVGVLLAVRDHGGAEYSPDDVEYLAALADTVAAALDNARLLNDSAMAAEGLRRQSEWLDQVSDAIITCDAENRVMTWNAGAEIIFQYASAEAVGCDIDVLLATRYQSSGGQEVESAAVFGTLSSNGHWSGELRQRRADGEEVEGLASLAELLDEDRQPVGWVAVVRDVTEERRTERLALYDPLTGLPNRRYLLEHLTQAQVRSASRGDRLALLFMDLDGFKQVNDTRGHEAGDQVLRSAATALQAVLRRGDVVARLGGDEFVVVAEAAGDHLDALRALAGRLIEAVSQPIPYEGGPLQVQGSVGVAVADRAGTDPVELLRSADAAMYSAKRARAGIAFAGESPPA